MIGEKKRIVKKRIDKKRIVKKRIVVKKRFVAKHLSETFEKIKMGEEREIIVTWSPTSTIILLMVGHTISIHNEKILYNRIYEMSQIERIRAYLEGTDPEGTDR